MNTFAQPQTILITGATGGIGGALALIYAESGKTLILQGRNTARLAELSAICESRGARVITRDLDVRDFDQLRYWLGELSQAEPIDLVVVNAGLNTNIGTDRTGERWEDTLALVEVNILAAMATINAILPSMRSRGHGQIALMSSLAAYYGLPVTPSYSASKAAIKAYGEALRGWLAPEGIGVSVIMPGYVESQMCRDMPGPKPFLLTAERAARLIRRGLSKDKPRISFPFPLNLGTWCLSLLRPSISQWILRQLHYGA